MRLNLLLTIAIFSFSIASAQNLAPIDKESSVKFKIRNIGFNTSGSFTGITGTIKFDAAHPEQASFDVSIPTTTINTGINKRDNHLRQEEYFDVKNYPNMKFVSTKVTRSTKGNYFVFGKITIKKVTKEVSFPFKADATQNGFTFNGEFELNRRDFGVGGGSTVSDNLTVQLSVAARKN